MVDALGNLFRFLLLPGQAHDMKGVAPLIHEISFGALLADKAFDADWLLQDLDERGATAVIPPKSNRKVQRNYDIHMYKWRHLVENYFAKIKEFRGIAQDTTKPTQATLPTGIFAPRSWPLGNCPQALDHCELSGLVKQKIRVFAIKGNSHLDTIQRKIIAMVFH